MDNEYITIDEAIRHCYEVYYERDDMCKECREEHKQLAKWLEELIEARKCIKQQREEIEGFRIGYETMKESAIALREQLEGKTAYQKMLDIKQEREMHGYQMEDPKIVAEKTIEALSGFKQYKNSELLDEYKKMEW